MTASASAAALIAALAAVDGGGEAIENLKLERQRALGGAGDLGFQFAKFSGGEAHLAGERLAMDEGRVERRAHQLVAVLRGDVDEIAEHVVVPDFQRADAGRLGVTHLQRGDDAARFVAQRARLVERGFVAGADEAAVAAERRQFVGQRALQLGGERGVGLAQRCDGLRQFARHSAERGKRARRFRAAAKMPSRIAARSRGPPRPTTMRDSARARSGAALSCSRRSARAALSSTKAATASSRCAISAGSVSGAASRCANSREPAAVTVRSIAARSEPRRSPVSVRMSSRLPRVAWSIASVAPAASRTGGDSGGRLPSLGALDISDAAAAAVSSTRENAPNEAVVATREKRRQPPLRGRAVEHVAGQRRHRRQRAQIRRKFGVGIERVGDDDLARLDARDLGGERRAVAFGDAEFAGRNVDPGERETVFARRRRGRAPAPADNCCAWRRAANPRSACRA